MMKKLFTVLLVLFASHAWAAPNWQDSSAVAQLFSEAKLRGTFVVYDVDANRYIGHDRARAETRFVPASTFKIPNSLIGLSTGAVRNVDEVLPYGGKPQWMKAWEQDMGLREAIRISNVPIFQELARRVGVERMQASIRRLGYGNGEIGQVVDRFWLDGPLRISATEQTAFLSRLAQGQLPFPAEAQAAVREITLLEQGPGWQLHGKTGWADSSTPPIGWWVGWVKKDGKVYSFALNIDMPQVSDAPKRLELGKASLRALGVL